MFDLKGNVAVVTGGGGGLGRQFALALAKAGAKVALLARRQAKLDAVKEEIEALGGEALAISTDVTEVKTIIAARDKILEQWGRVDILVNNAGGGVNVPIEELSEEDWAANRALDFDGVFYCMKYFGQVMLKQGIWADHQYCFYSWKRRTQRDADHRLYISKGRRCQHDAPRSR